VGLQLRGVSSFLNAGVSVYRVKADTEVYNAKSFKNAIYNANKQEIYIRTIRGRPEKQIATSWFNPMRLPLERPYATEEPTIFGSDKTEKIVQKLTCDSKGPLRIFNGERIEKSISVNCDSQGHPTYPCFYADLDILRFTDPTTTCSARCTMTTVLQTQRGPQLSTLSTSIYLILLFTCRWPSSSWMVWMSLTPLQQLGGATWPKTSVAELPGMPEAVDTGRFVDTGHQHRSLYSFLKHAQTQMVPALLARWQAVAINC
jgi:hypothetical protein